MSRTDAFLLVLQTLILRDSRPHNATVVNIFAEAGNLDEAALGTENPAKAALQFYEWQLAGKKKPAWLLAWEEGQRDRVTIAVNPAAEHAEWWVHAEGYLFAIADDADKLPFPDHLAPLVSGRLRRAETTREGALLFRAWVQLIPGFEQEPFLFEGLEA